MFKQFFSYGISYAGYALELMLFVALTFRGRWKRLSNLFLYLALLFTVDGAGRLYMRYRFGFESNQYRYFYWLSDDLLALGAFLLVCSFFRRAFSEKKELWRSIRFFLMWVFVLAVLITSFSLYHNFHHLLTRFITEFEQNLYFSCLVLNTVAYIMMHYTGTPDEELKLLVCGMGIQFAGPAATLAFSVLTPGSHPPLLFSYVDQFCALGMLLVWTYAVLRVSNVNAKSTPQQHLPALAHPAAHRAA